MNKLKAQQNVLIITNYAPGTYHSRLCYEQKILTESGYNVDIRDCGGKSNSWFIHVLTLIFLKFINFEAYDVLKRKSQAYDIIFLYGLQCLMPLSFLPQSIKKKCIYQTLNHDVDYHVYELGRRNKILKLLLPIIKVIARKKEQDLSKNIGRVIVNSTSLKKKFPEAVLNFYTSPLQGTILKSTEHSAMALLYLGQLRQEKIAPDFFEFINKCKINFFVFGEIKDDYIAHQIKESEQSMHFGSFMVDELKIKLTELSLTYNLLGVSLIQEPHKSYGLQNANKDIDYLAMGIPILGNNRKTTKELIEKGCGFFYNKFDCHLEYATYQKAALKCLEVYQDFNNEAFKNRLLDTFKMVSSE